MSLVARDLVPLQRPVDRVEQLLVVERFRQELHGA